MHSRHKQWDRKAGTSHVSGVIRGLDQRSWATSCRGQPRSRSANKARPMQETEGRSKRTNLQDGSRLERDKTEQIEQFSKIPILGALVQCLVFDESLSTWVA